MLGITQLGKGTMTIKGVDFIYFSLFEDLVWVLFSIFIIIFAINVVINTINNRDGLVGVA